MRKFLYGHLGECHICIRKALLAAATLWALVPIAASFEQGGAAIYLAVGASIMTLLWVGHIVAFLSRIRLPRSEQFDVSRRSSFVLLGRGLAAGAIVSFFPHQARAQSYGGCGNDDCDPCFRPFWGADGGGRVCWRCHSCGNDCGGQTC